MSILAITVYAGKTDLVRMTERMVNQLHDCVLPVGEHANLVAVNNGAERQIDTLPVDMPGWDPIKHITNSENLGFGNAVNNAIASSLKDSHTDVLVLNNDLEFPNPTWLKKLVDERESFYICSPTTDQTANKDSKAQGPRDKPVHRSSQVSAFCWLVPRKVLRMLHGRFGFHLFDPEFFAYGEDDYTGEIMRKVYGGKPFKVVPRSWVRHLKAKTAAQMGMRGGMKDNLALLKRKTKELKLR